MLATIAATVGLDRRSGKGGRPSRPNQRERNTPMDDDMKALVQQYIDVRRKHRNDLMKELGLTEEEADQAVSTLELYYHIEASEDQWTQAWKAAKRDFLA